MRRAGSTLVVAELIAELPYGADHFPITVMTEDGETCDVTEAESTGGDVVLTIDHDCSVNPAHDLLWELHTADKITKAEITKRISDYFDRL